VSDVLAPANPEQRPAHSNRQIETHEYFEANSKALHASAASRRYFVGKSIQGEMQP